MPMSELDGMGESAGQPRERFVYQLLDDGRTWKIGVFTPLRQDD